jgi:hypothetical protein
LSEGLKASFSGALKLESESSAGGDVVSGTWSELTLLDLDGESETLKSPIITDENYAKLPQSLENTIVEKLGNS